MQGDVDYLNDRVINMIEQTAVDALETCDVERNNVLRETH